MEINFLNQNSLNFDNKKKSKKIFKFLLFLNCTTIIILFSSILILYYYINNLKIFIKLFKEIKNEDDVKLYMKNKTEFYFKYRIKKLEKHKINYNESNLITFQDKVNYLLIHENPELKTDIVDKIKIHQYSKKILGKDICTPILKVYENVDEINLNELPEQFVLKANHGSGMNLICKDKFHFDINMAKNKLKKWKNINYGLLSSEFQYLLINRKIFAATYLGDKIIDYEFYCLMVNQNSLELRNYYLKRITHYFIIIMIQIGN